MDDPIVENFVAKHRMIKSWFTMNMIYDIAIFCYLTYHLHKNLLFTEVFDAAADPESEDHIFGMMCSIFYIHSILSIVLYTIGLYIANRLKDINLVKINWIMYSIGIYTTCTVAMYFAGFFLTYDLSYDNTFDIASFIPSIFSIFGLVKTIVFSVTSCSIKIMYSRSND